MRWHNSENILRRIIKSFAILINRVLIFLVEDVLMITHLILFVLAVLIFGMAYTLLTSIVHGVGQNCVPLSRITILKGLYFNVVTVYSLGRTQGLNLH